MWLSPGVECPRRGSLLILMILALLVRRKRREASMPREQPGIKECDPRCIKGRGFIASYKSVIFGVCAFSCPISAQICLLQPPSPPPKLAVFEAALTGASGVLKPTLANTMTGSCPATNFLSDRLFSCGPQLRGPLLGILKAPKRRFNVLRTPIEASNVGRTS